MLSVDFCTCSDHDVGAFPKAQERSMRGRLGLSVLWEQTTDFELLI
jgi:hypothetical protein